MHCDELLDRVGEVPEHLGPDHSRMVGVGGDPKVRPSPADLLTEHHVHQLRVVVVPLQGRRRAVGLVVDVVEVNLAVPGGEGGHVDHPGVACLGQLVSQQVGQ